MLQKFDKKVLFGFALFLVLDQLSKVVFYEYWFLNSFFLFSKVFNKWISWWIPFWNEILLIILSFLAIFIFLYFYLKNYLNKREFVLLFAWALWNLIDRILFWWVRDFIDFGFFPVFNFADIFLTIGIIFLIYREFLVIPKNK